MLGFAFATPSLLVTIQNYSRYVSEVIKDDSAPEIEAVGKFIKRGPPDPRQKVLWVKGVQTLRKIEQVYGEKVGGVLFGVLDSGEALATLPGISVVDAALDAKQTWAMHRFDLLSVMDGAQLGPVSKMAPKLSSVTAPSVEQKASVVASDADSLRVIFDQIFNGLDARKGAKSRMFVASRLEGILTKDEWTAALARIESYGIDQELVRAAVRAFNASGNLKTLRAAVRSVVVDGVGLDVCCQLNGARQQDLDWVDAHWALSNLTPDMFVGA